MSDQREELKEICRTELVKILPTLRKMNNLTQSDLAEILGISRQTITNIECGKNKMSWGLFWAMLFVFSLGENSDEYMRQSNIPFDQLKKWLISKRGE